MKEMKTDIAVIGGGAAGLIAAATAARYGARVMLLEKLSRVGKKLLLTGNGRCNLGNLNGDSVNWHGNFHHRDAILREMGSVEALFAQRGLYCRADAEGRLYPVSNTAASVLDALRFDCAAHGVDVLTDCAVTKITPERRGFLLFTEQGTITAEKVIFAVGGAAAPNCGTDGSAFSLIQKWHTISPLRPALAPIRTDAKQVSPLKGMRISAEVTLYTQNQVTASSLGEVQFSDGALSGICVFNLARYVDVNTVQTLSLRLLPEWNEATVRARIAELFSLRKSLPAEDLLTGLLPKRVGQALLKSCGISSSVIVSEIPANVRAAISDRFLDWRFPVRGSTPFQSAQVTAGGIRGDEVDASLMSLHLNGLYFAGECLDVDGDCGGFNLQWAWASGICAGNAAARDWKKNRSNR